MFTYECVTSLRSYPSFSKTVKMLDLGIDNTQPKKKKKKKKYQLKVNNVTVRVLLPPNKTQIQGRQTEEKDS